MAEKDVKHLIDYWSEQTDPGMYTQCVKSLSKYKGKGVKDPEGLCAWLHYKAKGIWPGEHRSSKEEVIRTVASAEIRGLLEEE